MHDGDNERDETRGNGDGENEEREGCTAAPDGDGKEDMRVDGAKDQLPIIDELRGADSLSRLDGSVRSQIIRSQSFSSESKPQGGPRGDIKPHVPVPIFVETDD